MATRYKAKPGSTNPDLDLLDTMYDEAQTVYARQGAVAAKEAARGSLDFYRLKAAPKFTRNDLRAQVSAALGPVLSAILFGVSTKAVPDAIDQAIARLTAAAIERAKVDGDTQIAKAIDALTAQLAPPVGGRATVADSGNQSVIPTKKEARDPWQNPDYSDMRPR